MASKVVQLGRVREQKENATLEQEPHFNVFAMCVPCGARWVATVHYKTPLLMLECPACGAQESFPCFIPDSYSALFTGPEDIK